MSVESLAARIDALDADGAFVSESEVIVSISNLSAAIAREVGALVLPLGWRAMAFDGAGNDWALEDLDESFAPFRVDLEKPVGPAGVLRLLTNVGFASWLERDVSILHWQVAQLTTEIVAVGACFTPWGNEATEPVHDIDLRSPRTLVREFSGQRAVPASLGRWLLRDVDTLLLNDPAARIWAERASRMLLLSLPDEFDVDRGSLRFRGPPRLELSYPTAGTTVATTLGLSGIKDLQEALAWVFEIERESEMRHILLATELARCGGTGDEAQEFLRDYLGVALEGAKTAYQVQLAGMSSDALKTLIELRKSVTDETAKVSDATRQIITAVASALAVGAGLIAARMTTNASPLLIILVMVMAGAYVAITILSGVMFTFLQRKVRREWQPRLYRFLSQPDYEALVAGPARTAEKALWYSSILGTLAIIVMVFAIFLIPPALSERKDDAPIPKNVSGPPLVQAHTPPKNRTIPFGGAPANDPGPAPSRVNSAHEHK
ncbi:hypothetical protein [Acetobacter thailandicus]|uniref:hypothetical protein n=1 Tax=Acetobacter thailandicus TaxID=1502842 RepID=UPI001BA62D45|nr:hypothetical protein [Acetobacter thailandicus]MBS0961419.1 hypothetical protein [Acetobacter thailandicus]